MDTNSPEAWFKNLPVVTRSLLVAMFSTTCLVMLGLLDPFYLILDWGLVYRKYHLWRLFSSGLFLGGFSFGFVMQLYLFTSFGGKLERHQRFTQGSGDYIFFLLVISLLVSCLSLLLAWPRGFALTGPSIIFAIIYYWSRCEPEAPLSIWGFSVKGYQLPFALVFVTLLMGGDVWKDLLGIAAGHLYHFLKDILAMEYNMNPLKTPLWVHKLTARLMRNPSGAVPPAEEAPRGRVFIGGGYRLGGN